MRTVWLKVGALILSAIVTVSVLSGCRSSEEKPSETTVDYLHNYETSGDVSISTGKAVKFIQNGASDCTIVWSNYLKDGNDIIPAARQLAAYITSSTGVTLQAKSDMIIGDTDPTTLTEILIGETSREESALVAETLRVNDYAIQVVNNKLVVLGGCEAKTIEAIHKLVELYFSADRTDFILESGYRYQFRYDYPLLSLTLGENSVLDYTIVYAEGYKSPATYLQTALTDALGRELPMVSASVAATDHEILVGETGRNGSITAEGGQYKIGMNEGNLVFSGDVAAVTCGVRAFVAQYMNGKNAHSKVEASLSMNGSIPAFESSMKLLNLNVTLSGYAENAVVNRYPRLYQMVMEEKPDVLCLQEVSGTTWKSCITQGIEETPALTETYEFVGTGRNGEAPDGYEAFLEGAYNAILFNKSKYKLEDSGTFWLSETPTVPSVGWDGRTYSICTWAKLTEISTGKQIVVMNTQLDGYGRNAPLNGMKLICDEAAKFDVPVILAGDFNCASNGKPYTTAIDGSFADTLSIAETVQSKGLTYHAYGQSTSSLGATSHVLVSRGFCGVKSYALLTDLVDGGYVSAHWAIVTQIEY